MKAFPRLAVVSLFVMVGSIWTQAQQLQCNACSHGYGRVVINTTKQYNFPLANTGSKTLHILAKSKKGQAFSFGAFPLPVTLLPGQSIGLPVKFTPKARGKTTGSVTLTSDASNPTLTMSVWGTGIAADSATLGVSPTSLNFGDVTIGNQLSLPVTLTASNGAVTITSAKINEPEFTIAGLTLPLTIASGQSAAMSVIFQPLLAGPASGTLTLTSDAGNSPTRVALAGTGVAAGAHSTDLSWQASIDPVVGYNIYRGTTRGGPYGRISDVLDASTTYTDSGVQAGKTYFYVVTAVDAETRESAYSNEVKVVIPTP